ncbi:MAG: glycosyltransferase family 2 protein [Pseudomonadota bacterium]
MQPVTPSQPAPWLSVLVPVYNVGAYVGPCIDSILAQAIEGVEILLLDDGSTDDSPRICEARCAQHARSMRLLRHAGNRGLSIARNTLLEAAAGRYCWFLDSDDEMLPGAIAALRAIVDAHAPDMILCDYHEQQRALDGFSGSARTLSTDREALVRGIFESRRMYIWNHIARRETWGDLRFPAGRYFEDIMTTPWLCLRARSFFYADQPWIRYRLRGDSIMSTATRDHSRFNQRMNDDLAGALAGFHAAATASLPPLSNPTQLAIANFCARNFTDMAWRLLRARLFKDGWKTVHGELQRYRATIEQEVPSGFASVAHRPLREMRIKRWIGQVLALALTSRVRATARTA